MTNYHDVQVKNNAYGTLSQAYSATDTTLVLNTGEGARFPTLTGSQYFFATLLDTSNNLEIIKVTAISSDTLTVVRGQESTTARSFATNDRVELRVTAGVLNILSDIDEILPDQSVANDKVLTSSSGNVAWDSLDVDDFSGVNNTNTAFFSLPSGTTVQRPATAQVGYIRYNNDHYGGARPEYYATNSSWLPLNSPILNKYVVSATAAASGATIGTSGENGVFPSINAANNSTANTAFTSAGFTANEYTLTPINTITHNKLAITVKPMSSDSIFLLEYAGSLYSNSGYVWATFGRSTGTTAANCTLGSTKNVAHIREGGDGTSIDATSHSIARWHSSAHVHQGAFAAYDDPGTTDFVRYCIHFSNDSNHLIYVPFSGIATFTVTELDGSGTTKVSTDTPLEVNT